MNSNSANYHYTAADQADLREYIREINESSSGGFALTECLEHWAGYGIYTRDQLGDYLDECVNQEEEWEDDNIIECDDDVYYRECMSADTGDDISKADYIDMYSDAGIDWERR